METGIAEQCPAAGPGPKKELGKRDLDIYSELLGWLEAALEETQVLGEKLATQLENQSKASLFTRVDRFRQLSGSDLPDALAFFNRRIRTFSAAPPGKPSGPKSI